jgi:hypothetical protein
MEDTACSQRTEAADQWDVLGANFGLESARLYGVRTDGIKRCTAVDKEQNVTITENGLKRLAAGMYEL